MKQAHGTERTAAPDHSRSLDEAPTRHFLVRSGVGLAALVAAGALFALALAAVAAQWQPLQSFDDSVVGAFNALVHDRDWLVTGLHYLTDLGGAEALWIMTGVVVGYLLVRRLPRLATYVAVTGLGALVLTEGVKALVGRTRPLVDVPLATAPDASFPSGHTLGATVTYGVLLLVFLPVVPRRGRPWAIGGVVVVVAAIGLTRIGLGVHYPSDVLGGWTLGMLWLVVTGVAFERWRREESLGVVRARRGLAPGAGFAPEDADRLEPAPVHDHAVPGGWHGAARLLVGLVTIWGALVGVGFLVTDVLHSLVHPVDLAVAQWFADIRTPTLTDVAVTVGQIGGTVGIVVVMLAAVPLAMALTRRWTPGVFLVIAVVGETALFLGCAAVVGRPRPPVEKIAGVMPPTASFPSGHVAATLATYGAITLLVWAWTHGRAGAWLRWAAAVLTVLAVLAVALSRLYRGMHWLTDVVASVLYAAAWLAVCWHVLRPGRGSVHRTDQRSESGAQASHGAHRRESAA